MSVEINADVLGAIGFELAVMVVVGFGVRRPVSVTTRVKSFAKASFFLMLLHVNTAVRSTSSGDMRLEIFVITTSSRSQVEQISGRFEPSGSGLRAAVAIECWSTF